MADEQKQNATKNEEFASENSSTANLEAAQAEAADYKDRWMRAVAESQNMKRRFERERADLITSASERLLLRILPVIDDFDLAFANVPATLNAQEQTWMEGFALIQRKLHATLVSEGVTIIDTQNQLFDPSLHEAVTHEAAENLEPNKIIGEIRKGYKLGERVLRPALVRVAQ